MKKAILLTIIVCADVFAQSAPVDSKLSISSPEGTSETKISKRLNLAGLKKLAEENLKEDAKRKIEKEDEELKAKAKARVRNGAGTDQIVCSENDKQESIPLSMLYTLAGGDRKIDVNFDARTNEIKIHIPQFVNNCSDMISWRLKQVDETAEDGKVVKTWTGLEAHIKRPLGCASTDATCSYTYFVKDKQNQNANGQSPKTDKKFQPTLTGFNDCLIAAGVINANGDYNTGEMIRADVKESVYTDLQKSTELFFVSHGPDTGTEGLEYKKELKKTIACDKFEEFLSPIVITTLADIQKKAFEAEADKYRKNCDGYQDIATFLDRNGSLQEDLVKIRDEQLEKAAQNAVSNIKSGKYDAKDIQVMADFNRYIVSPLQDRVNEIYDSGEEETYKEELAEISKRFKQYNTAPYFSADATTKLLYDGRFADAQKLNTMKLTMDQYSKIGTKTNGVLITPDIAHRGIQKGQKKFNESVQEDKENYAIRSGEVTGMSKKQVKLARRLRQNIQTRTANFTAEIQAEFGRMQYPNGTCYKYWVNTQKCVADSQQRIQELHALMVHTNKVDGERANEADEEAQRYRELEEEGRRIAAARNGEDPEEEAPKTESDPQNNGTYAVSYNQDNLVPPQQQVPQSQYPQQQFPPQQYMPQGQYYPQFGVPQQQPFLGQQAYSFNYGQQIPQSPQFGNQFQVPQSWYGQQQPQPGLGSQAPGFYGNYSMFGFR